MKYRKKPVVIEAVKYNGGAIAQLMKVPVDVENLIVCTSKPLKVHIVQVLVILLSVVFKVSFTRANRIFLD